MWSPTHQPRRIFGWKGIFDEWRATQEMPLYVRIVMKNLDIASRNYTYFPVSHFLDFVNHEQEPMAWLVYEFVSHRIKHGGTQLNLEFLRSIVDLINNLDSMFPMFPSAPFTSIREFLEDNLTNDEIDYVQMLPRLIPLPASPTVVKKASSPSEMIIRVLRKGMSAKEDDIIYITNNYDGTYNIVYNDQVSEIKTKTSYVQQHDLLKYLSTTLRLMTLDTDPFESIQCIMPNAPSVMISTNDLTSQTRDLIYDTVEGLMVNWPRVA